MAKRISRAKQQLRSAGVRFDLPPAAEWAGRLQVVLHVLYLVFSEGYTSTSGPDLQRADLTTEAIRLARLLHQLVPADGEVVGLLALMLLTDARRAERTTADGSLVPLAEQRRDRWDTARIQEGVALLTRALGTVPVGPTSPRRPSPPSTRRPARPRPTGRRSWRCTRRWSWWRRGRRSPSTARSRSPWSTGRAPASRCSAPSTPPATPTSAGPDDHQPARAALPDPARRPAGADQAARCSAAARLPCQQPHQVQAAEAR